MSTLNKQLLCRTKIEKIFLNHRYLLLDLALSFILCGSNYSYLEQLSVVPKMFEPLKFDCILNSSKIPLAQGSDVVMVISLISFLQHKNNTFFF